MKFKFYDNRGNVVVGPTPNEPVILIHLTEGRKLLCTGAWYIAPVPGEHPGVTRQFCPACQFITRESGWYRGPDPGDSSEIRTSVVE